MSGSWEAGFGCTKGGQVEVTDLSSSGSWGWRAILKGSASAPDLGSRLHQRSASMQAGGPKL